MDDLNQLYKKVFACFGKTATDGPNEVKAKIQKVIDGTPDVPTRKKRGGKDRQEKGGRDRAGMTTRRSGSLT